MTARPEVAGRLREPGEAAPWFRMPVLSGSSTYTFDTAAGRPILMLFYGSAGAEPGASAVRAALARRPLFDDDLACFFGICTDPEDARQGRIAQQIPGIRWVLDYERSLSRLYGADPQGGGGPHWLLLDPMLRVVDRFPIAGAEAALGAFEALVADRAYPPAAPVLVVPRVLEPELCRELIALYEREGGQPSGFMRDVEGKTVLVEDPKHKVRRDHVIDDPALQKELSGRVRRRLLPMVRRAFQFDVTRMERYLIGCYDAGEGGHFRPHRDNTTRGTAHRRFAVTINLNAEDYQGGDLRFPEFGPRSYRAPTGGAVVFSCGLLHQALPVTKGRRYAFLPFLYDEEAAKLREENSRFLADSRAAAYRA